MTHKLLILVAGPSASGKTTTAEYIETTYGAHRAKYSDILTDIADSRGIPRTKASLQRLSTELRKEHGEDYLTTLMRQVLEPVPNASIVLEGNRRMVDLAFGEAFAKETGRTLVLIYIDADSGTRRVRMNLRLQNKGHDMLSEAAFDALDSDECEEELPRLREEMAWRGAVIDNTHLDFKTLCVLTDREIARLARPAERVA